MTRSVLKFLLLLMVFFAIAGASAYLTLTLIIESEETVVVPELEGKDAVAVLELLSGLGLNTKVKDSRFHADIAPDHVIYQDPAAGTPIKKGRDVKVILSKGPETFSAPKLSGISLQQARVILSNNGLTQGVVTRTFSPDADKDMVIAQTPPAGMAVTQNDAVSLLVSRGSRPEQYRMPDLKGRSLDQALKIMEKSGITLGEIDAVYRKDRDPHIVIEQRPLSGYYVQSDQAVNLTVNRRSSEKNGRREAEADQEVLFRYQIPPGVLKQHIRVELKAFGTSSILYDQLMKPGREIWVMIPKYADAVVFLYQNEELVKTEVYR